MKIASLQMELEKQFSSAKSHANLMMLFSRETYVLRLAGEFAVLLTFGVVFPPLAIVVFVAIVSQTLMSQRLTSRLLMGSKTKVDQWEAMNNKNRGSSITSAAMVTRYDMLFILFPGHFSRECAEIREYIALVIPYISGLMMMFLSFSLFDTMADSDGNDSGFVVMACLAVVPMIEYFVAAILRTTNS